MAKSFKNGTPVNISLETHHKHDADTDIYKVDKMGEIASVNGHYYMRYVDEDETGEVVTTIKLHKTGNVTVMRRSKTDSNMIFDKDAITQMQYQTPYGNMVIDIITHKIDIAYRTKPFSGDVSMAYDLRSAGMKIGEYKMMLSFTV